MQDATDVVRSKLADYVLKNKKLQNVFCFPSEAVQIKGRKYVCKDVKDWSKYIKRNGAWGDNSVIQIFANITGITVHVLPTDNLEVEGVITHCCPQENHLDDAAITLIYGGSHYQIAVPTCLPKSVEVTTSDSPELVPVISLSEDED